MILEVIKTFFYSYNFCQKFVYYILEFNILIKWSNYFWNKKLLKPKLNSPWLFFHAVCFSFLSSSLYCEYLNIVWLSVKAIVLYVVYVYVVTWTIVEMFNRLRTVNHFLKRNMRVNVICSNSFDNYAPSYFFRGSRFSRKPNTSNCFLCDAVYHWKQKPIQKSNWILENVLFCSHSLQ